MFCAELLAGENPDDLQAGEQQGGDDELADEFDTADMEPLTAHDEVALADTYVWLCVHFTVAVYLCPKSIG